ncbi:MAG: response regulator receiver protein [Chitinophagaceae bacterium]|nr:response regulator receiver protein [Chitinophagaceae bacterium]
MGNILLIEDDEIMQKVVEKILMKEGYKVDVAKNGREALQKLEESNYSYDLMITDIMMPYANGFEIITKVKSEANGRLIPIIVISSVGNEDSVLEGFKLGADDYLKKPIMAGELIIRVKRLLARAK